ncbi:protein MULTIPLE CHLOROPLAST DIVISION SITE 1 [Vigna radiata var. radiata]|uniref:Protein MULTIPLE CHLOROPLAST DIVISION SITE 1 n=1 Tax=Vigna radiata var. radiata TaxID=3916 RepID=A0A1S3TY04_VIGRR|nr:protein MULTIPLE CHLOROPLAST DIVISION SITE 1 [Vigna radiata var. radiata]
MASVWTLQFRSLSLRPCSFTSGTSNNSIITTRNRIVIRNGISKWRSRTQQLKHDSINSVSKCYHQLVNSVTIPSFLLNRSGGNNFPIWVCVALVVLVGALRVVSRKKERPGSVADLVRRGQLKSDRRGISRPLKYEDPFNNPFVKVGKSNSTVEMCGKVYRLAPVTLTEEQQATHQRRRSRAYQWKRPTIFLREGDSVPPDVDPDTVRWIPANHPFATTATDLDEDLAQNNVYQKHGVPFRIQAEHEALQKKLEALQNDQKLNKLVIDPINAKEFERPFNSQARLNEQAEKSTVNNQEQKINKLVIDPISAKEFERPFNSHARLNDQAEKSSVNNQVSDSDSPNIDSDPNHFESTSSEDPTL